MMSSRLMELWAVRKSHHGKKPCIWRLMHSSVSIFGTCWIGRTMNKYCIQNSFWSVTAMKREEWWNKTHGLVYVATKKMPMMTIVSPVVDFRTLKPLFSIAKQRKWAASHLDFQNAFPSGKLECSVYTEVPEHLRSSASDKNKVF